MQCDEGICVKAEFTGPVTLGQPTIIQITVSSDTTLPALKVIPFGHTSVVSVGNEAGWMLDATPGLTQVYETTITFTTPGLFDVGGVIFDTKRGGQVISDIETVLIAEDGTVTLNPTDLTNQNDIALQPNTPTLETTLAVTPAPPIEGFTPEEWIAKCGWLVDQPETLTEWDASVATIGFVGVKTVGVVAQGNVTFGFKDAKEPNAVIHAKIGLCMPGQGWTAEGVNEWETDLQSSEAYIIPVAVRFTEVGAVPMFLVALDEANHRVAGFGRLIMVVSVTTDVPSGT